MVKIAVMGHGVVGSGVVEVLMKNHDGIERRAKEEQRRISGRISSEVYGKTAGLRSTVYAATKGSNVGGDTCIRVLEQALKRLTNICNVLAEGSGPSGSGASRSFGSSSQNLIHGTDAISAKQASLVGEIRKVTQIENIFDLNFLLRPALDAIVVLHQNLNNT